MKIFLFAKLTAPRLRAVLLYPKYSFEPAVNAAFLSGEPFNRRIGCNVTLRDNMKIKVKQNFYDRENDLALREKGAEMEVSEQRGRELIAKGFAAEVKPKEEKKTESEK